MAGCSGALHGVHFHLHERLLPGPHHGRIRIPVRKDPSIVLSSQKVVTLFLSEGEMSLAKSDSKTSSSGFRQISQKGLIGKNDLAIFDDDHAVIDVFDNAAVAYVPFAEGDLFRVGNPFFLRHPLLQNQL